MINYYSNLNFLIVIFFVIIQFPTLLAQSFQVYQLFNLDSFKSKQIFDLSLQKNSKILYVSLQDLNNKYRISKFNITTGRPDLIKKYIQPNLYITPQKFYFYSQNFFGSYGQSLDYTIFDENNYQKFGQTSVIIKFIKCSLKYNKFIYSSQKDIYYMNVTNSQTISNTKTQLQFNFNNNSIIVGLKKSFQDFYLAAFYNFNETLTASEIRIFYFNNMSFYKSVIPSQIGKSLKDISFSTNNTIIYSIFDDINIITLLNIQTNQRIVNNFDNSLKPYFINYFKSIDKLLVYYKEYSQIENQTNVVLIFYDSNVLMQKKQIKYTLPFKLKNVAFSQDDERVYLSQWGLNNTRFRMYSQCQFGKYYDSCIGACVLYHNNCLTYTKLGCNCLFPTNNETNSTNQTNNQNTLNFTNTTNNTQQNNNQSTIQSYQQQQKLFLQQQIKSQYNVFQQSSKIIFENDFQKSFNSIPGIRVILKPFFGFFSIFDNLWLYSYHQIQYNKIINDTFDNIRTMEDQKWNLFGLNKFIGNFIKIQNNTNKNFIKFKQFYTQKILSKFQKLQNKSPSFFINIIQFIFPNLAFNIIIFIFLNFLYKILSLHQLKIAIIFIQYSFNAFLFIMLMQGNLQYFMYLLNYQFKNLFQLIFMNKLHNFIIVINCFIISLLSISSYFLFRYIYQKESKHLYDIVSPSEKGSLFLSFQNSIRHIFLAMFHQNFTNNQNQKNNWLFLTQLIFFLFNIYFLQQKSLFKNKLKISCKMFITILIFCLLIVFKRNIIKDNNIKQFTDIDKIQIKVTIIILNLYLYIYIFNLVVQFIRVIKQIIKKIIGYCYLYRNLNDVQIAAIIQKMNKQNLKLKRNQNKQIDILDLCNYVKNLHINEQLNQKTIKPLIDQIDFQPEFTIQFVTNKNTSKKKLTSMYLINKNRNKGISTKKIYRNQNSSNCLTNKKQIPVQTKQIHQQCKTFNKF